MMAKAPKIVTIPVPFPLKGWDTNWARHDQPQLTTPGAQNVLPYDLDGRARGAKRGGFQILTGAAVGTVAATYRPVRVCADDTFASLYFFDTAAIPSYPFSFQYGGICYYITDNDEAVESFSGAIIPTNSITVVASCEASVCSENPTDPPPPPPDATYKIVRTCDTGLATGWKIAVADIPDTSAIYYIKRAGDNKCYKVLPGDPESTTAGTSVGTVAASTGCNDPACTGSGGTDTDVYYELVRCSDDTALNQWVSEAELEAFFSEDPVTLPKYFVRYDFLDTPVYIPDPPTTAASPTGTEYYIGTWPTNTLWEVETCTKTCGWPRTLPATIDVTFADVVMATDCVGPTSGAYSAKVLSGSLSGTYTLTRSDCQYSVLAGITVETYSASSACTEEITGGVERAVTIYVEFAETNAGNNFEINIYVTADGCELFRDTRTFSNSQAASYEMTNDFTAFGQITPSTETWRLGRNGTATITL